jgi:hypothetical protein
MTRTIFGDVAQFERRLSLPDGFYDRLIKEDDWSFVIKLNSLFEGACTHVLAVRLHSPELLDALAHLDFAHSKFGKIAMLRSLNAITPVQFSILRCLAELRNQLVHRISNVAFMFNEYVATLDKNQPKALIRAFGNGVADPIEIEGIRISRDKFVVENPKLSLWLIAAELLACLFLEHEVAELSR